MMIGTPKLVELPFSLSVMGTAGFLIGKIGQVSEKLSATVLAVYALADNLIYQIGRSISLKYDWVEADQLSKVYTATNAAVSIATIVAARQLELLSLRTAGALGFLSAAILVARINLISLNQV